MSGPSENSDEQTEVEVIDYQVEHMVNRALAMVSLKYKANSDKKIAVMVWGGEDMGASFLNVPDSLHRLAHRLNSEGDDIAPTNMIFIVIAPKPFSNLFFVTIDWVKKWMN